MTNKEDWLIEYKDKIEEISLDKIQPNELNPREKFLESEEDELIESILSKGILNPIIVYRRKEDWKYIILDGERRFRACRKLNIKAIPAHVLIREPTALENLSMMFHIHNVREEWTDFAISLSLKRIISELGKNINNLNTVDIRELKKITSLSEYKLKKYLKFHYYPDDVIAIFLEAEKKEKPGKGIDPDILSEMHKPIVEMKKQMPELMQKYSVKKIIQVCIQKKANNIIVSNKEFRLISKALTASKKGDVRTEVLQEKIIDFLEKPNLSPNYIYETTSQFIYQIKEINRNSDSLYEEINNLDMRKISSKEHSALKDKLQKLLELIEQKILK